MNRLLNLPERKKTIFISLGLLVLCFAIGYRYSVNLLYIAIPVVIAACIIYLYPITAIYMCLISDLWLSGFRIFGVNPRTIILIVLILALAFHYFKTETNIFEKTLLKQILPALLFLTWMALRILIEGSANFNFLLTYSMLLLIVVFTQYLATNEKALKNSVAFFVFIITVSSIFAILQDVIGFEHFTFLQSMNKVTMIAGDRPAGLSITPMVFSYEALAGVIFLLAFILNYRFKRNIFGVSIIICIIILLALLFNATRSAIAGVLVGIIIIILFQDISIGKKSGTIVLFAFIIYLAFTSNIFPLTSRISDSHFVKERGSLFAMAFFVAKQNPLGVVSSDIYFEKVEEYEYVVSGRPGASYVTFVAPHNHFLNVLVYFGIPGIALLCWFFYNLFKSGIVLYKKTNDLFYRSLGIGLIAYLIGYIVNASFHNAGPMRGDKCFWYVIAIFMAAYHVHGVKSEAVQSPPR